MPNKTISVPDDVVPIIEGLNMPFSRWVTEQLRRHSARSAMTFAQQLIADAALSASESSIVAGGVFSAGERLTEHDALAVGKRMGRSAAW